MKKNLIKLMFLCFCAISTAYGQSLNVATYNIRNHNAGDSLRGDGWTNRLPVICRLIQFHDFDVFGNQEVLDDQLQDMLSLLPGYGYIGVGREDGAKGGEYSPILYKKDRLLLLKSGNFWLNETPDKPVLGWDAACTRICTWGEFKDKTTGKVFYLFNTHFDHVGVVARAQSCLLILKKIKQIAGTSTTILMGDFNTDQKNEVYGIFTGRGKLSDAYNAAPIRYAQNGTFNAFNPARCTDSRIDHIFTTPTVSVAKYGILTDTYWDPATANETAQLRLPSDHYPVATQLILK